MKRFVVTCASIIFLLTTAVADHHGEKHKELPWLDMEKCEICKNMGEHMDMMQDVTWETHKIDNGMLSASVIPAEHRELMDAVHQKMHAVGKLQATGKEMKLCGFCDSYGALKKEGAKEQVVATDFGMIMMLTSDDPELVTKIHAHADRTIKEFAAFSDAATPQ